MASPRGERTCPLRPSPTRACSPEAAAPGSPSPPIAFLAVKNGSVRILQIEPYFSPVDRALEKIPDVMDKLTALVQNFRGEQPSQEEPQSQGEEILSQE